METTKIAIFDVDGALLDMVYTVYRVAPWLYKFEEYSPIWEIFRKIIILFRADRITDERLRKTDWATEFFEKNNEKIEKFIVTNRPFIFGAKKRLLRQLEAVYGKNFFCAENIYSAFGKGKSKIIKEYILKPGVSGDMYDDCVENFKGVPESIQLHLV